MTGTHFPNWDGSVRGLVISAAEDVTVAATAGVIYLLTDNYEADVAICSPEQAIAPRFPALLVDDRDPWAPFAEQGGVPWGDIPFWFDLYPSQSPNPLTGVPVAPPSGTRLCLTCLHPAIEQFQYRGPIRCSTCTALLPPIPPGRRP